MRARRSSAGRTISIQPAPKASSLSSLGRRSSSALAATTMPAKAARAAPTHLPHSMVANERCASKSRPMRLGVNTSTSPASSMASGVNPGADGAVVERLVPDLVVEVVVEVLGVFLALDQRHRSPQ